MNRKTLQLVLCAPALALLCSGCVSEPEPSAEPEPSSPEPSSPEPSSPEPSSPEPSSPEPSSPEPSSEETTPRLVPPFEGPYDEMWKGLRGLDAVSQPIASESAQQILAASRENDGAASAQSLDPRVMIINLGTPEERSLWSVAYTDSSLLKPDTYSIVRPPREALIDALYDENVLGLSFNPYTKASREEVFNFSVDKLYIAGLIGYLTTEDADRGHRCEAANAAYAERAPYETLHHALRALDEEEAWSECELAKLWAMWELDFPGSRAMAREELEWFIGKGNDTAETRAMLEVFRNASR